MDCDVDLVVASVTWMAECEDAAALVRHGLRLAKEELSEHDRLILRAVWSAKREWLEREVGEILC